MNGEGMELGELKVEERGTGARCVFTSYLLLNRKRTPRVWV